MVHSAFMAAKVRDRLAGQRLDDAQRWLTGTGYAQGYLVSTPYREAAPLGPDAGMLSPCGGPRR